MIRDFFLSSYRLDNAIATLALFFLVLTHLVPAYDSYKLRQRITEYFRQANQVKALVEVNFAQGNRLFERH